MSEKHSVLVHSRRQSRVFPGARFGKLTVLGESFRVRYSGKSDYYVVCQCDCDSVFVTRHGNLQCGNTRSCGCWVSDAFLKARKRTHGYTHHPLYRLWAILKYRCHDTNIRNRVYYSGRGIGVCPEWSNSAVAFIDWALSHGWKPGLQIDRIDNGGNYGPSNCRFVTPSENCRNRRNNRVVTAFGETKLLCEWAEDDRAAVGRETMYGRLYTWGWPPERAITTPSRQRNKKVME